MNGAREHFQRHLVFIHGKGGVGKTAVSLAAASALARKGRSTLWVTFEDPVLPEGEKRKVAPNLWHLNCVPTVAFEEYATILIKVRPLAKLFVRNALIEYLSKAAPGIREIVMLGKVWFERTHHDHVIVDLPSTGYSLAMFNSVLNFAKLFKGGPVHRDALLMEETFGDPALSAHVILGLPEEMPLREALDLGDVLKGYFPDNAPAYLLNRRFPDAAASSPLAAGIPEDPDRWEEPVAMSATDYALRRSLLEKHNLRIWKDAKVPFSELPFLAGTDRVTERLSAIVEKEILARPGEKELQS